MREIAWSLAQLQLVLYYMLSKLFNNLDYQN